MLLLPPALPSPTERSSSPSPAESSRGWIGAAVLVGVMIVGLATFAAVGAMLLWPRSEATTLMAATAAPAPMQAAARPRPDAIVSAAARPQADATASAAASKPPPVGTRKPPVVAKATATTKPRSTTAPVARVVRKQRKPVSAIERADPLGAIFIDENHGYSIRFPAGWSIRTFGGEPWVVDSGDGRTALISIGFAPFPLGFTAENIPPDWIARRIQRRPDTALHGQGYAKISGQRALWSKSTGPLRMTHASPRMTRVTYILPTGDGRVMELRVAAAPEQFERLAPVMRRAVATFKLVERTRPSTNERLAAAR